MNLRILMFGWEFPPLNSGGLGTACYGITKALSKKGVEILFVLPRSQKEIKVDFMRLLVADNESSQDNINMCYIDSILKAYTNTQQYANDLNEIRNIFGIDPGIMIYGSDLFREVLRYTNEAEKIGIIEDFDVIHCHDWMTFGAGVRIKRTLNRKGIIKPLILHVHATEFDRTGGNPNEIIYHIEKFGMDNADQVITVSNYTKNIITYKYGIPESKIAVVYNGIEVNHNILQEEFDIKKHYKIVLFLGRITLQKGPDWFLKAAWEVTQRDDSIRFVVAGNGDMFFNIVEESANLGISDKVFFTDFLRGIDIDRAYSLADLYVMTSVSEPFGITALESLNQKTPIIVSKQSGVSEVIKNCYKIDFWDTKMIADSIIEIVNNPELHNRISEEGYKELSNISWDNAADNLISIYGKWGKFYG